MTPHHAWYTGSMSRPMVSVVITVRNDAQGLQELLTCLDQQTHQPHEIIITVAESHDETLSVAKEWQARQHSTKVFSVGSATRARGRNLGVAESTGELIVFIDAGCFPEQHWLAELLKPFVDKGTVLVSGLTLMKETSSWQEAQGPYVLVSPNKIGKHPLPATRNMAIRRKTFLTFGGFLPDLNYAEDYEFSRRLQEQGIRSVFASKAIVRWQGRSNLLEFGKMIFNLTRGDMQAHTWRTGHYTMWGRYGAFFVVFVLFQMYFGTNIAIWAMLTLLTHYLLFKVSRLRFQKLPSYLWALLLQLITDVAVLAGTAYGLSEKSSKV
jgi:glycosyltransferase involved in cell wall biosynthesis